MAILVWITLTAKDGNCHQVLELLDSPEGKILRHLREVVNDWRGL